MRRVAVPIALGGAAWLAALVAIERFGNAHILLVYLTLSLAAPIAYLFMERAAQERALREMKAEAVKAELLLLKRQINPHFFFNTLNNLYGLVVEGSEHAPEMILRLSDLMRFTLYEGKKERVPLCDEIEYLENYIALHRIRFHDLDFRGFIQDVDDDGILVPPLLLILPIENAFKHGAASMTEGAWLKLSLTARGETVQLVVENSFEPNEAGEPGIGMANLRRRLALLFPDRHRLSIDATGGVYRLDLTLEGP